MSLLDEWEETDNDVDEVVGVLLLFKSRVLVVDLQNLIGTVFL
jgi:hypothetical protein